MKLTAMTAMVVVMGTTSLAGDSHLATERKVTVCMERGPDLVTVHRAQSAAAEMFAGIGVKIEWHGRSSCPPEALRISFSDSTPAYLLPGALAYALPNEGTHIVVFYDRISKAVEPGKVVCLLTHVVAHEVTHILQGMTRHSESGVMKAYWDEHDFFQMAWKPLVFTEEDVLLIHSGLEGRYAQLMRRDSATVMQQQVGNRFSKFARHGS